VSSQSGAFSRIADYTCSGLLHLAYTLRLLRGELSAELFASALEEGVRAVAEFSLCWAIGNHDVPRLATRWGGAGPDSAARVRLVMTMAGALPGTLCLYQGDELGLPDARLKLAELRDPFGIAYWPEFPGRDGARTPMPWRSGEKHAGFTAADAPWLPIPDAHHAYAVDVQERDPESPLRAWRDFLAWRRRCPILLRGKITGISQRGGVLSFERVLGNDRILCVFNVSSDARRYALPEDVFASALPVPACRGWLHDGDIVLPAWGSLFIDLSSRSTGPARKRAKRVEARPADATVALSPGTPLR